MGGCGTVPLSSCAVLCCGGYTEGAVYEGGDPRRPPGCCAVYGHCAVLRSAVWAGSRCCRFDPPRMAYTLLVSSELFPDKSASAVFPFRRPARPPSPRLRRSWGVGKI